MRILHRVLILGILACLLSSPVMEANPGGNGDGTRDFACGGSCHADPDVSLPSSAVISMNTDRDSTFVGGPLTITADIVGMELSERKIVGVFLTTGTFGVDDSPDNSGWAIISDSNGGSSNYVESYVLDPDEGISVSWSLSAPSVEGTTTFHIGIHHGGDGIARLGDTNDQGGVSISVGPIPENFPQLLDWTPITQRNIGEETVLQSKMMNVTSASVEWKISGSEIISSIEAEDNPNGWEVNFPTALADGSMEYRWRISNSEFETTTAWTTLSTENSSSVDENPSRLLMLALAMITASVLISLQRFMAEDLQSSNIPHNPLDSSKDRVFQSLSPEINLGDPRRPEGWSDEQWTHYGPDYIASLGDDI
jgi:hypothetical protein